MHFFIKKRIDIFFSQLTTFFLTLLNYLIEIWQVHQKLSK